MAMVSEFLTPLVIALGAAVLFGEVAFRLRVPRVIGYLLAGGVPTLPWFAPLFTGPGQIAVDALADLGIVFLLFLVGMEINGQRFSSVSRDASLVALFAALLPLVFGFAVGKLFGYSDVVALVLGAALALTAEGTNVAVLLETKVLHTRLAALMVGAAVLDSVFGVLVLSVLVALSSGSLAALGLLPLYTLGFALFLFVAFRVLPKLLTHLEHSDEALFGAVVFLSLAIAFLAEGAGLGLVAGAFLAGFLVQFSLQKEHRPEHRLVEHVKVIAMGFLVPFFFLRVGLLFFTVPVLPPLFLLLAVLLAATLGKFLGVFAVRPFTRLSRAQAGLVGAAMNSRGAIELVIAQVALSVGLLPPELFTAIVSVTVLTTLFFPFYLKASASRRALFA